jgi:hypothetical protein
VLHPVADAEGRHGFAGTRACPWLWAMVPPPTHIAPSPSPLLPPMRRPGQLCRTTDVGVVLEALGTTQYCHRVAVEKDFYCLPTAPQAIDILNRDGQVRGTLLIWWRRPLPSSTLCHPST